MLLQLLAAVALAAPPREVGHEQPAPLDLKAERYTEMFLTLGSYLGNRGNASARPDGSGTAQVLTHLAIRDHAPGDHTRFLADLAFVQDRKKVLAKPSSFDYYIAMTRLSEDGRFLQVGRDEALPLDIPGRSTRYWDLRGGKYWGRSFGLFAGWHFKNHLTPAMPDLSGEAFMRYAFFLKIPPEGPVSLRVDGDFLTDEHRRRWRPASLDLSVAGLVNWKRSQFGVAYKPWYNLVRRGISEAWLLVYIYHFDGRDIYKSTPGVGF